MHVVDMYSGDAFAADGSLMYTGLRLCAVSSQVHMNKQVVLSDYCSHKLPRIYQTPYLFRLLFVQPNSGSCIGPR